MRKKVELVWRKETESGAEGLGLQRGVESRGAETPVASPTPEAGLKDWCRGGRGAERAAAVAAARLPAPEHAREPPRSPLLPRPRRPAPRRQVSPALGKEAGGRGEKQKEKEKTVEYQSGLSGLRGGVATATSLAPADPTLAAPRARGSRSAAFLLPVPKSPGRGAIPRPGQQAAALGRRAEGWVAGAGAGFSLTPLSTARSLPKLLASQRLDSALTGPPPPGSALQRRKPSHFLN